MLNWFIPFFNWIVILFSFFFLKCLWISLPLSNALFTDLCHGVAPGRISWTASWSSASGSWMAGSNSRCYAFSPDSPCSLYWPNLLSVWRSAVRQTLIPYFYSCCSCFAKANLQHEGETSGEYPSLYIFSRTLLIKNMQNSSEIIAFGSYQTLCIFESSVLQNRLLFIY